MADQYAPSIIFIDEFDSFASKRISVDHEASRRMKSEMFLRIDQLIHGKNKVFLLAATNCPWYKNSKNKSLKILTNTLFK